MLCTSTALCGYDMMQCLVSLMGTRTWYATNENEWITLFSHYLPDWLVVKDTGILTPFYSGESSFYLSRHLTVWLVPIVCRTAFVVLLIWVMFCINVLLRKQWIEHERLAYPIVELLYNMTITDNSPAKKGSNPLTNRRLWAGFAIYRQTVETIYQGMVHNQEPHLRQLTTAVHWVGETTVKPSLYLVTAVLHSQLADSSVTVSQVRNMIWNHDLTRVEQRPFFEREPTWQNVYYSTCRFSHDLLKETMRAKVSPDEISLELVVKELVSLINRSEIRLGELIESTAVWLGLIGGQKRGFPAVSTAVADLAHCLIDSGQAVGQTVFAMCWFFCSEYLSDRSVMREPTLFQDLERVTESITRHLQPNDVAELCRMRPDGGSAYPLIDSFSGWLAGFALRSRQVESENLYFWSMAERQIPALASMAQRLTEDTSIYHRLKIDSEKNCYIQLLAWAGKYRQAGDTILEMIRSLPINQRLSQQSIGWANQAITAYWQAGAMDRIHHLFSFLAQSYETPILQRFFQKKLELICNSLPTSLFDFEWRCANLDSYQHDGEIMILQNPINPDNIGAVILWSAH